MVNATGAEKPFSGVTLTVKTTLAPRTTDRPDGASETEKSGCGAGVVVVVVVVGVVVVVVVVVLVGGGGDAVVVELVVVVDDVVDVGGGAVTVERGP